METRDVDVAVIGAGSAGLNARRQVEKHGGSVVMIESGPYGTTCARVGCMPSKLLIAAADAAFEVGHAERFGVRVPEGVTIDGPAVLARVRAERDRFVGFVVEDTEALPAEQRLRGHARFVAPGELEVEGEGGARTRVRARATVIATGSAPRIPAPFDAVRDQVLVNDDVFELEDLPESLAVVGAGIIGLELGQAMARLGVRVSFFNRSERLGPFTDPAVRAVAREILSAELDLRLGIHMRAARTVASGMELEWEDAAGATHSETFARVLVANGRVPQLEGLALENAGVVYAPGDRLAWDPETTQVGDHPIFLAGDVSAHRPLLHEAADEGRIAGENAVRFPDVTRHARRAQLAVAFTDPQIAVAGASYADLDPEAIEIGEVSYANQGRARVMGRNAGLVRLYASRAGCQLVGAELFGPRMEHMAHTLAWVIQEGMTVQHVLRMPFYHPVFEEGLRTALTDLAAKLRVTGACPPEDLSARPAA